MKRVYNNYFLVGLFIIIIGGLALFLLFKMSGKQSQSDTYYSYFTNVTGLGFGNPVYFEGYRVGQVEKVTPEYQGDLLRFKTEYTLIKNWKVPIGSLTTIQSSGLLSDMSLGITSGGGSALIKPGSEIASKKSSDIMATVTKLAENFDRLSEEKITPLLNLVYERVDNLSAELDQKIPLLLDSSQSLLNDLNGMVDNANSLISGDNHESIDAIISNIESLSSELKQVTTWMENSFNQVDGILSSGKDLVSDGNVKIQGILDIANQMIGLLNTRADTITSELESASMNVNEATNSIRKDPSSLLFDKKSKIADEDL